MNKYFITINENRYGYYDFIIELFNEEFMEEKAMLGNREDIVTLGEILTMIEEFPLSENSELVEVKFNRRNLTIRLNKLERLFVDNMNDLVKEKPIKEFKVN